VNCQALGVPRISDLAATCVVRSLVCSDSGRRVGNEAVREQHGALRSGMTASSSRAPHTTHATLILIRNHWPRPYPGRSRAGKFAIANRGHSSHNWDHPSPFVGREAERAVLRAHLEHAVDGRGSLVLVGGEAGNGKTVLIEALGREAEDRGVFVLTGHCYDLTTTPAIRPLARIGRRLSSRR
jgi:AAA ATPase domain